MQEFDARPLVLQGGKVYTLEPGRPWAEAIVIRGGEIALVGTDREARSAAGREATVVDLAGKMVLPGLVESHIHFVVGAMSQNPDLPLAAANTYDELVEMLERYARRHAGSEPVLAWGWKQFIFPEGPRKETLDRIFGDRAVQLRSIDGHSSWVSSGALSRAGVDANFPDPQPGFAYLVRDADGEPTGLVKETASDVITNALVTRDRDQVARAVRGWQGKLARAGLTTVYDAGFLDLDEEMVFEVLDGLARRGELDLRIVGSHMVAGPGEEDHVGRLLALRARYASDQVSAAVLKIYLDGVQELHTAFLLAPYADRPETAGVPNLPPEKFRELVMTADAAGIDVHVHAIGEGATRLTLDAVEGAVRCNRPWDRRHTSCHVYYVDPDDLPRFAQLGVIGQTSGEWIVRDEFHALMERRIGRERTENLYRLNTLVKSGATITLGSDWPASCNIMTYEPLVQIEMAHTRRPPGERDAEILPPADECLSLPDALAAMTINAARQIRRDDRIGSLVAGKRADLVVLERNLFDVAPHEIHRTGVLLTMMDGRITYRDPSWDGQA